MPAIDRQKLREMNLLDQTRIGYEQKQAYQDWLARLSAEGYLTDEEYSARMDWLFAARTEEEMKLVFRDLPRLKPMGMEPANPNLRPAKAKKKQSLSQSVTWAGTWFVFALILMVSSAVGHRELLFIFDTGLAMFWGGLLTHAIKHRNGR